jgi:hypothetical protein
MRKLILISLLLTCALGLSFSSLVFASSPSEDRPTPKIASDDHGDPVLKAMLAELKRSQEKLQLGQLQRPYYIDYQVTELEDHT